MAIAGALVAVSFKKISHLGLCVLISFAAGALLAVSAFHILPEAAELAGWTKAALGAVSGYLLFWVLTRYVFHVCPACSATHTEINFKGLTKAMVVALSVHSFMDGLAIYSGFMADPSVGFLILAAVAYHKFPEGMALTLVARGAHMDRAKSFIITALLESFTTLLGAFAGAFVLIAGPSQWGGVILAHVGGGFIFIVLHALLSEVIKHHPRWTILAAILGAGSILVLGMAFGHAH
jgi:zinc transporter ZupT